MTTVADRVSASQQRQRIPTEWLIIFNDWTNESVSSLAGDMKIHPNVRAYAQWESEYREAFEVMVVDSGPELVPHQGHTVLNEIVKRLKGTPHDNRNQ